MSSLTIFVFLQFAFLQFVQIIGPDPEALQDFCVADFDSNVRVNGYPCKDRSNVTSSDFYYHGLATRGNTDNRLQALATQGFVTSIPGLNTLGIAMARIDFGPYGLNTPHHHPRASEILIVLEGTLLAGFVSSEPEETFYSKILEKGDLFIFPRGLVHFQQNLKSENATAIAAFNSQAPGRVNVADGSFGSSPSIPEYILANAFQISPQLVAVLQAKFSTVETKSSE